MYASTAADRVGPNRPVAPAGVNVKVVNAYNGGNAGAPPDAGGVIPLMITALVVGDANAPTCEVRTIAPKPGFATETPPDLDALAAVPEGTYCAAALTKDVKSDPDGRRTGIID